MGWLSQFPEYLGGLKMQGWTMSRARLAFGPIAAVLCVVLLFAFAAVAADGPVPIPLDAKGLPMWGIAEWNDFPIVMEFDNHDALDQMLRDVPLASFNREQVSFYYDTPKSFHLVVEPRVTKEEASALTRAGYNFTRVVDEEKMWRQDMERIWAEQAANGGSEFQKGAKGYYPTHSQLETLFADLAASNPTIARTFTWGSSVEGRDLLGIVISNDVNNTTAEPEVRLSAQMHGDEPSSMVMLVEFADYLVTNYGLSGYEDVTSLVDNYEIHIMPMHNPDGYVAHSRYNDNGTDLNRNFPEPAGTHPVTEVENINYMNYANAHHFVISQNGHSGALVVNYPWDYTYDLAPDNDALIKLSLEYSTHNIPMYNSSQFSQGITNGAAWYVTTGCVQDWSYDVTGCIDVTIEVSNTKWPDASTLDDFWDDNRESLMHFTKSARYGVNGVVTGSDTGLPLDATVSVLGNVMTKKTDPAHGDYYKLLDTGSYDITYSAYGYIDKTIYNVSTTWGTPTVLDVVLDPVAHGDVSGYVTTLGGTGLNAQVSVFSHPGGAYITTVGSDANGAYTAHLVYGDYRLDAIKSGYVTQSALVTIGATAVTQSFAMPMAEEIVVFKDDFESGDGMWSGWGIADPATGYNSTNSLNDSPGTVYDNDTNTASEAIMSLNLSTVMSGELEFRAKWDIENTWDACFFEVSTNGGGNWTPVATQYTNSTSGQGAQVPSGMPCFDDSKANWVLNTVDLAPYIGQSDVRFRFRLISDGSIQKAGFFVDDFQVTIIREQETSPAPSASVLAAGLSAYPNPFNPQTTVKFTNPSAGNVNVGVYDIHGRLIRTLVSDVMVAGEHSIVWDGHDEFGAQVASGVYFARMDAGSAQATRKLMMVK